MENGNKKTPLGNIDTTERGFTFITFADRYGVRCSLQQSSLAECEPPGSSAIWLGVDAANHARMHLDVKQVKALVAVLEQWIASGSFAE